MTQQDKDLLLRDLCARLPYHVKIDYKGKLYTLRIYYLEDVLSIARGYDYSRGYDMRNVVIKPYLRPMSSMTHSEYNEYLRIKTHGKPFEVIDWLNARHIDYRKLIEKGLAIAVTDENNPYK